jgi:phosphohistidine phosphatase
MKLLLLLRHADSAEKMQGQTDKERALTGKGARQSSEVGEFMKAKNLVPERIIASSAVRVRTTVELIAREWTSDYTTEFIDDLYEADEGKYLEIIRQAGACQSLLIAGHNPSISAFASHISRTRTNALGTGHLVVFQFKGSEWPDLDKGLCELMEHFAPLA